jgi:transcriptional regulator with GAF, ATPase, and Fis domain
MLFTTADSEPGCAEIFDSLPRLHRIPAAEPVESRAFRIVGGSAALRAVLADLECVAPTPVPVLILGETGTGKDLVARRLHQRSARSSAPLVQVDCTTLTPTLMEAELFGHVRGAFTGATADRAGRVKLAAGGTLFLNEIGELPLQQQSKLLRLIQDHEYEPVGSSRTQRADVRIVAATNRDLAADVAAGSFRADLYYRLAGFPLLLPPLRERLDDLPALVEHLLQRQAELLRRPVEAPSAAVMAVLQRHDWPGNIRELRAVIERACIRSRGRGLIPSDFSLAPASSPAPGAAPPPAGA